MAASVAESWSVNTEMHIIRKMDYKGSKQKHDLKLAFDAFTLPAMFFIASCWQHVLQVQCSYHACSCAGLLLSMNGAEACAPLQIRSCSGEQQKAIATALKMFLGSFCPKNMTLNLLPSLDV